MTTEAKPRGRMVLRGIAWTSLAQIVQAAMSFAAMLFLVRMIPPGEYGRVAVVLGILTFLNIFNSSVYYAHALQLGDGIEPDWDCHWYAGALGHLLLGVACQALAGLAWLLPSHRSIAPLLHLAGIGLLLDWPNQLGLVMLRREMDFRRIRLLAIVGIGLSLVTTLLVAGLGHGAVGIVLGQNVLLGMPVGLDLLLIKGWRPRGPWFRWPDLRAYRASIHFGSMQILSAFLWRIQSTVEAMLLPVLLDFGKLGLWNRAQGLYSMTVGRAGGILHETTYPLLPRFAANRERYPIQATLFLQVIMWLGIPATCFVALAGPLLSHVLYGMKWSEADTLIAPGALIGFGLLLYNTCGRIMVAANRIPTCVAMDGIMVCLCLPMILIAWKAGSMLAYAWGIAGAQFTAAILVVLKSREYLIRDWFRAAILPPLIAGGLTIAGIVAVGRSLHGSPASLQLLINAALSLTVATLVYRGLFAEDLVQIVDRLPGSSHVRQWLWLPLPESAPVEVAS